ncbi:hypothetical protein L6452_42310 [Arctium lappa]|uniref:Uncharacterized protein n=1 Tax=Arctium lappa TaxID=4217 RepID=A0ACB8XJN3_ARCLA|nr:hypothetical protein L6452_42310 [Arctium lappa]
MMLVSPPLFSTTYGWPLDDPVTSDLQQENSNSSGGAVNGGTVDNIIVGKKLNHNASERDNIIMGKKLNHNACERDRRKRVNDLYAFLRSLLPMSTDPKHEEDGLVLLSATTFACLGEERFLDTLHLQVQRYHKVDAEKLKEKLCSFYQQSQLLP